jgi:hypothetical protein
MKYFRIIITIGLTVLTVVGNSQFIVDTYGKVGINNPSPSYSYHLDVNGDFNFELSGTSRIVTNYGNRILFDDSDIYSDNDADIGFYNFRWDAIYITQPHFKYYPVIDSDRRLKKDIRDLDKTLNNILNLRPVRFKMLTRNELREATGSNSFAGLSNENVSQIGLIAQEVQEIFPEIVSNNNSNYLGIQYTQLVPVLIKGLQEQQEKIEKLKALAETMENNYSIQNGNLKSGSIENTRVNQGLNSARLYPNDPNLKGKPIIIRFEIPESVQDAHLYFFNMNGTLLKTIKVYQRGEGNVIINANELKTGMYLYSLVTDRSIVDTKQMLMTK